MYHGTPPGSRSAAPCLAAHSTHLAGKLSRPVTLFSPSRPLPQVLNFKKRYGSAPVDHMDLAWAVPERFVARRANPHGPGWEVLVKWGKLGYEHATWEVRRRLRGRGAPMWPQPPPHSKGLPSRACRTLGQAAPHTWLPASGVSSAA